MTILLIIVISFLFSVLSGQVITKQPESRTVPEGTWANFSCTYKFQFGHLKWRIGAFSRTEDDEYFLIDDLENANINGLNARLVYQKTSGIYTEVMIEIFATGEIDGAPVQCMVYRKNTEKNNYSKFSILKLTVTSLNFINASNLTNSTYF